MLRLSADALALFRRFRHDLLNELQIVSGHLQLGRPHDVVRQDVQAVVDRILEISQIFACHDDSLALLLWDWLEQARDLEISVSYDLCELVGSPSDSSLERAADLVSALLPEIVKLDDQERWLHVRLDDLTNELRVTSPLIPVAALRTRVPALCDSMQISVDEEMEFSISLLG